MGFRNLLSRPNSNHRLETTVFKLYRPLERRGQFTNRKPIYEPHLDPRSIVDLASYSETNRQIHNRGGRVYRGALMDYAISSPSIF